MTSPSTKVCFGLVLFVAGFLACDPCNDRWRPPITDLRNTVLLISDDPTCETLRLPVPQDPETNELATPAVAPGTYAVKFSFGVTDDAPVSRVEVQFDDELLTPTNPPNIEPTSEECQAVRSISFSGIRIGAARTHSMRVRLIGGPQVDGRPDERVVFYEIPGLRPTLVEVPANGTRDRTYRVDGIPAICGLKYEVKMCGEPVRLAGDMSFSVSTCEPHDCNVEIAWASGQRTRVGGIQIPEYELPKRPACVKEETLPDRKFSNALKRIDWSACARERLTVSAGTVAVAAANSTQLPCVRAGHAPKCTNLSVQDASCPKAAAREEAYCSDTCIELPPPPPPKPVCDQARFREVPWNWIRKPRCVQNGVERDMADPLTRAPVSIPMWALKGFRFKDITPEVKGPCKITATAGGVTAELASTPDRQASPTPSVVAPPGSAVLFDVVGPNGATRIESVVPCPSPPNPCVEGQPPPTARLTDIWRRPDHRASFPCCTRGITLSNNVGAIRKSYLYRVVAPGSGGGVDVRVPVEASASQLLIPPRGGACDIVVLEER